MDKVNDLQASVFGVYTIFDDKIRYAVLLRNRGGYEAHIAVEEEEAKEVHRILRNDSATLTLPNICRLNGRFVSSCAAHLQKIHIVGHEDGVPSAIALLRNNSVQETRMSASDGIILALVYNISLSVDAALWEAPSTVRHDVTNFEEDLFYLTDRYGLNIIWRDYPYPIMSGKTIVTGKNPQNHLMKRYAPLFISELNLYPSCLIRHCHLDQIVLSSGIVYKQQQLAGFLLISNKTLYLNASYVTYSETFIRRTIHHELFHAIDHFALGHLLVDKVWEEINESNFRYGCENAPSSEDASMITDTHKGFLNGFATTTLAEDKATVFSHLLTNYQTVETRAKQDNIIYTKMLHIKNTPKQLCPEINDTFWQGIKKKTNAKHFL